MLRLRLGDLIAWDTVEYTVLAIHNSLVLLSRLSDHETVWVDIASLSARGGVTVVNDQTVAPLTLNGTLPPLTSDEVEEATRKAAAINVVKYGVENPSDPAELPAAGYDVRSKTRRRALKAAELGVAPKTLQRWEAMFDKDGFRGLIGRKTSTGPASRDVTDEVYEALNYVLEDLSDRSTITTLNIIDRAKGYLARHHPDVPLPHERTLYRVVDELDLHRRARGKATTRRNEGNRPGRAPRPVNAFYPGQYVEIDSSPNNVMAMLGIDADGQPIIGKAVLTAAIDIATRTCVAFSIVPVAATGALHSDLLARILRPRACRPDAPDYMRLESSRVLPHGAMIAADERQRGALAMPYIVPETITTDQGSDFFSTTFRSGCQLFGISIREAAPGSPTFKGHIERFFRTADTKWMQNLPGYIGNSVENRGREPIQRHLTIAELTASFEEWLVRVYQNRPHKGLPHPYDPSRFLTPNQAYALMFNVSAGVPVPIDESTYIALMPVHLRTIQARGIQLDNVFYVNGALTRLANRSSPRRDGKWEVHKDPVDDHRVWIADPETGDWIECLSERYHLDIAPFANFQTEIIDQLGPSATGAQAEWAAEMYAKFETKRAKRRRARTVAIKEQRALDKEPRPGPIETSEPATRSPRSRSVANFRTVSSEDVL